MIKCPNCGGELKFTPKDKVIKCEYCSSTFKPSELKEEVKYSKEVKEDVQTTKATSYQCSQCGGTLLTFDETAVTFCSYCGSQAMLKPKMVDINNPDYIIPFKITKEECIKAYKKKINKAIFAPRYMKDDVVVEKFRGIYMPYVVYKVSHHGNTSNGGRKFKYHRGNYDYYNDYVLKAEVDMTYEGVSYDLVSILYDKYTHHIPYNFKEAEPYNPNYLIGYYADTMDVDKTVYDSDVRKIAKDYSEKKMKSNVKYAFYGCHNPTLHVDIEDRKVGMFPVYFLAIRDKNKKYIHYAIVNGQTGKVATDIPIDFGKYVIGSLLIAALLYFLLNVDLILLPSGVLFLSIAAIVLNMIISANQLSKIRETEEHFDDIGYVYKNKLTKQDMKKVEKEKKEKNYWWIKHVIGIVIAVVIWKLNPVNDMYYYAGAIINFLIAIYSFYDLVKQRNRLVSNKLPQLEKRGGDENA